MVLFSVVLEGLKIFVCFVYLLFLVVVIVNIIKFVVPFWGVVIIIFYSFFFLE